jgi:ABC-2 family transporter protein
MTWLVWRQHRMQLAIAIVIAVALGGVIVVTGRQVDDFVTSNRLNSCVAGIGGDTQCQFALNRFYARFTNYPEYAPYASFLAVLFAALVGAPLVAREVEQGTHRLIWSQSVSRTRWFFAKLWPLVAVATVLGAVQGLAFLWWWGRFDLLERPRLQVWYFDVQGVAPIGYAVFALALGVAAGAFVQRTIAAMVIAAGAFAALRLLVASVVREHYTAPKTETRAFFDSAEARDGWIVVQEVRDRDGREVKVLNCDTLSPEECQQSLGISAYIEYHPAERFWTFQVIELAFFLALAAALLAAAWWRVCGVGFRPRWPRRARSTASRPGRVDPNAPGAA